MEDSKKEKKGEDPKEIRVVSGNPKDLDISPVYDHIEIQKPTNEKKKHIIVPEEKEKK